MIGCDELTRHRVDGATAIGLAGRVLCKSYQSVQRSAPARARAPRSKVPWFVNAASEKRQINSWPLLCILQSGS